MDAPSPPATETPSRLDAALRARAGLFDEAHEAAFRLFNGFLEGAPDLAIDLYARTAVIHDYANPPREEDPAIGATSEYLRERLPWLRAIVLKRRHAQDPAARRGVLLHGNAPDRAVRERGVHYAIDLTLGRDAGLYLDTRNVRDWARRQLGGKTVLNAFAYTGSLGVAARASGAPRVVQLDHSRASLEITRASYALNGFAAAPDEFRVGDFFAEIGRLKRSGELFDCVFLDPPLYSSTRGGTVDMERESGRLINRVRPLVADGGALVAINNALFVSGGDWLRQLEALCADGYLAIEELIPVPPDFAGYPETRIGAPPADPAPFNHSTKIVVLRVRRK